MSNFLDMLLKADVEAFRLPETKIKIKRFSEKFGADAVITLRALPFDKIEEIREGSDKDFRIRMLLAGIRDVDFTSTALKEKLGLSGDVPSAEVVRRIFTAGEIEEIYLQISRLSGYGADTIEEIKKK